MRPIEGSSPDPFAIPDGCSYEPRCPISRDDCRTGDPEYQSVREGYEAACFYWEDAAEAVPLSIEEPDVSFVERDRTPRWAIEAGIRCHLAGMSLREVSNHLERFGIGLLC